MIYWFLKPPALLALDSRFREKVGSRVQISYGHNLTSFVALWGEDFDLSHWLEHSDLFSFLFNTKPVVENLFTILYIVPLHRNVETWLFYVILLATCLLWCVLCTNKHSLCYIKPLSHTLRHSKWYTTLHCASVSRCRELRADSSSYHISYRLFSFRGSVQDYRIHMDMDRISVWSGNRLKMQAVAYYAMCSYSVQSLYRILILSLIPSQVFLATLFLRERKQIISDFNRQ